ncbi:minor tail protein [Mycobacterium phage MyraDee]|uniref:Minor tail protein n=1 Tax=Mycobacterium phage MyraDee TaxID=2024303 RepID=A0A222Z058_9CAUD|nr:minor tail protein [Mycobacterium phage MyraDee]ASR77136.1 minor tail protein [Mycobacterium phage MyraDee]
MNPAYNPETFLDLIPYFLVGLPAIIAAWATLRGQHKTKAMHQENKEATEALRYEVTNDHSTNIRHDIDEIHALISGGFHEVRKDIGGLREELRTERLERIAGDRLHIVRVAAEA